MSRLYTHLLIIASLVVTQPTWARDLETFLCPTRLLPEPTLPNHPTAFKFQAILDAWMTKLKQGTLPSQNEIENTSAELLSLARENFHRSGVETKLTDDGRALLILPRPDLKNPPHMTAEANRLLNYLPRGRKVQLIYAPEVLLTDVSRIEAPMMFEENPHFFLSHLDAFRGPRSDFFAKQLEIASNQYLFGNRLPPPELKHATQFRFQSLVRAYFNSWTMTSNWPKPRKVAVSEALLLEAEKLLDEAGVPYRRVQDGTALEFLRKREGHRSHSFTDAMDQTDLFQRFRRTYLYSPSRLIELNRHTLEEEWITVAPLMHDHGKRIQYLNHHDILFLKPYLAAPRRSPQDRKKDEFLEWTARYFLSRKRPLFSQSTREPIITQGKAGFFGHYVTKEFDELDGSAYTKVWSDPFLAPVHVIHRPRKTDFDYVFDRYLEDADFTSRTAIGTAIQIGTERVFYDLQVATIRPESTIRNVKVKTPLRYQNALESYLNYLEHVYMRSLNISPEQYEPLRKISLKLKDRSFLLMMVEEQLVESQNIVNSTNLGWSFRSRLPADVVQSDLAEVYASTSYSDRRLDDEFKIISGLVLVTSRSENERLPSEIFEGKDFPRPRSRNGKAHPTAEATRMGNADPEMSLAYVRAAALKLKALGIEGLYIKVDRIRKRHFEKFGFQELPDHPDLKSVLKSNAPIPSLKESGISAKYYPSGTEFSLYTNIDEFIKRTLGLK